MKNVYKLTPEQMLLGYTDIEEDDRFIRCIQQNKTNKIVVWYPNLTEELYPEENEEDAYLFDRCSPEIFEEFDDHGIGDTIEEAMKEYVEFLQGKTACFVSECTGEKYLVTFDFYDPATYDDNED